MNKPLHPFSNTNTDQFLIEKPFGGSVFDWLPDVSTVLFLIVIQDTFSIFAHDMTFVQDLSPGGNGGTDVAHWVHSVLDIFVEKITATVAVDQDEVLPRWSDVEALCDGPQIRIARNQVVIRLTC